MSPATPAMGEAKPMWLASKGPRRGCTQSLVILICVFMSFQLQRAAAVPSAWTTPADESGVGPLRALLQEGNDCSRTVANCETCRFQMFAGSVTRAICTKCAVGYVIKASGRGCWCAPGYYKSGSNCLPCGNLHYCPGAKSTDAASRYACGTNKVTQSQYGRSDRDCVVQPGYGWAPGNNAAVCPVGFYNPGYNTRRCSSCPGGLTSPEGSVSTQDCVAPPGYYYQRGRAVPCAQGYYKATTENRNCDACPEGFTTQFGTVAATSPSQCSYVMPGYEAAAGQQAVLGTVNAIATQCVNNTYRAGATAYDNGAGIACTPCPDGMQTLPDEPAGATSRDDCLSPPGYGYFNSPMRAEPCPLGWYNYGWNREPCTSCGIGTITTDAPGATSEDECKVPAGHGSEWVYSGGKFVLSGFACPNNTYGRPSDTYGLDDRECTKCMRNTYTLSPGSTSQAACLMPPGYGYDEAGVDICYFATWSPGGAIAGCTACGTNYNTTTGPNGTVGVQGADSADDCVLAAGWTTDGNGGMKSCTKGTYKTLLGTSACVTCPSGTTTTILNAATERSDCDACRAGFGAASIDLQNPACAICESGSYSPGGVKGGQACAACAKPTGYTGNMVSRRGISSPEDCYTEFPTDAVADAMAYDVIPMDASVFNLTSNVTRAACEALCAGNADCQYFAWYDLGDGATSCYLRGGGLAAADITGGGAYILFELREGVYVAYNAHSTDWASTGAALVSTYTSFAQADAACRPNAQCIGIKSSGGGAWATFGGALALSAVSKVRVTGVAINPWVPELTP